MDARLGGRVYQFTYQNGACSTSDGFSRAPSRLRGDVVEPAAWLGWGIVYRIIRDPFLERVTRLRLRLGGAVTGELTREQRRRLAEAALRIAPELPDRQVTAMVGVSHQTVGRLRVEMDHPSQPAIPLPDPNPDDAAGGWSYDSGMATIERERQTPRLRFPATSTPTSTSTLAVASRPPVQRVRRDGTRAAVFAGTPDDPSPHFVGWQGEVDVDRLFRRGAIFGIAVRSIPGGSSR